MQPRKVVDRKPDLSDMRESKTPAGVFVFEVTILPSGNLTSIRLLSEIDSESPWPTIAQRVKSAIADWRYEPVTVNNRPVTVCGMVVRFNLEVM